MLEWVSWFVIGFIYNIVFCYIYAKLNKKSKVSINIILCLLVATIYCISLPFKMKAFTILLKFIFTTFLLKKTYRDDISKSLITTFLIYVIFSIGEMIFAILFVGILNLNQEFIQTNFIGILGTNIIILLLSILLIKIKFISQKISNIIEWYRSNEIVINIILIAFGIMIIFFFIFNNYRQVESKEVFLLVNLFFVGIIVFIIQLFIERTNNIELTTKYDQLLDYVKSYGEVIDDKSKKQHEYMNQLILIKEMLGNRNKKIIKYIDELLELEEEGNDYNWLNKLKNIPNLGLNGLIHYKVSEMVKNQINVYVDINENVDNRKLNKYLQDNLKDISRIICIYLDNAREAALESDNRYIVIEAECNKDKFEFCVSNTYKGNININKLDTKGYSNKGKGRGNGLSIIRDIIDRHNEISQYRELNGMFFVQKTGFQYKNKTNKK